MNNLNVFIFFAVFFSIFAICIAVFYFYNLNRKSKIKRKFSSYEQDESWKKLQQHLPPHFRINEANQPKESFWKWNNYNIHLDYYRNPNSSAKVILLHGLGTNGRQISLILGQPLAKLDYEVFSIDLPGYGLTKVPNRSKINYAEWVDLVSDFIRQEACKDRRPIFICGVSAGGMLALQIAAKNPYVKGIVGLTFGDLKQADVQKSTMRFSPLSDLSLKGLDIIMQTRLKQMRLPVSLVAKMYSITNNPSALKIMLEDPLSAGSTMSVNFLDSYLNYQPTGYFEDFTQCPVLLTQPAADSWTPLALSKTVLEKLKVEYQVVMLPKGSHYPLEREALDTLISHTVHFIETHK